MDRVGGFVAALAASAVAVGAVVWSLSDVRVMSFEPPATSAPVPADARAIAVIPLDWFERPEEKEKSTHEPSLPAPPEIPLQPWTRVERPGVAAFARKQAQVRAETGASPPPDELAIGVPPRTRRASASRLPDIMPAERPDAPELQPGAHPREPVPPPPEIDAGRLEVLPPLAEELLR